MQSKAQARKDLIAVRSAMANETVDYKSRDITGQLKSMIDWKIVQKMHCFLPIIDSNEPDMRELINYAYRHNILVYTSYPPAEKGLGVAKMDQTKVISHILSDSIKFDLIIVPMLAFNPATNHRLGYGGGFYDRLLAGQPKALKVGVCFQEFATQFPVEPHDQPLDRIVSA